MAITVVRVAGSHRLDGDWEGVEAVNGFLGHLQSRAFSPATVRAYAFDLLCFGRFCIDRRLLLAGVAPTDLFDWVDAQMTPGTVPAGRRVVPLARRGAAPATVNRRVAAVRSFFEHLVLREVRTANPGPVPFCQGVAVDPECGRGVEVAEAAGDDGGVLAGADELGGGEVSEVVEAAGDADAAGETGRRPG